MYVPFFWFCFCSHSAAPEARKIRHVHMPEKVGIVAAAAVAAARKIDVFQAESALKHCGLNPIWWRISHASHPACRDKIQQRVDHLQPKEAHLIRPLVKCMAHCQSLFLYLMVFIEGFIITKCQKTMAHKSTEPMQ